MPIVFLGIALGFISQGGLARGLCPRISMGNKPRGAAPRVRYPRRSGRAPGIVGTRQAVSCIVGAPHYAGR